MRSFLAILVVVGSALPCLAGASASAATVEPVAPTGGCWRYTPGSGAEIDDANGIVSRSVALEPWAADPQLTLATAGDTVAGGVRTFSLKIAQGPSVSLVPQLAAVPGTATYLFDVLDSTAQRTPLAPVKVDFVVPVGTSAIPAIQANGAFQLAQAGTSALILRAVYFDLPDLTERIACNGQTMGDLTTNPATTPKDTSLLAAVSAVPATGLAVTAVRDQVVLDAARPGDEVKAVLSGFASEVAVPLGFCGPTTGGASSCGPTADTTTLVDGSASATLVVPDDAVTGAGSIRARSRVGAGDVVVDQPMRVLGEPTVELRKTSGRNRLRVVGSDWDPLQRVRVTAVDDDGARVGRSVRVKAGASGRIEARLSVDADAEVATVVAAQQHGDTDLEATVDVPAAGAGGGGASSGDGGSSSNAGAPAEAPAVVPVDIPAPVDLPVTTVSDPQLAGAAAADSIAVTKVRLTGSTRLADLFGAGPKRVLRLRIENVSAADVIAPGLSIAVGKGDEADPIYRSDGIGRLAAGKSREIAVPISLPVGAFGVYTVTGQLGTGDAGTFAVGWETYPWGLFVLNGLGVLLIAFAVRRRIVAPTPKRVAALAGAAGGDAVIDLEVLERWWALQAAGEGAPQAVEVDAMADAVVDVTAVERWLERCSARNSVSG